MALEMVKFGHYIAGWLDSSVHEFLLAMPAALPSIQYALVTCLDSNRELAGLLKTSPAFASIKPVAKRLGQGILLPTSALMSAEASNRIMFGFDEVWFFPHANIQPLPPNAGLVGPRRINQDRMNAMGQWMEHNSCSLALGDGEGLNCVLQARGLVRFFVSNSIHQAEPSSISRFNSPGDFFQVK